MQKLEGLIPFWSDEFIDLTQTDAHFTVCPPQAAEVVMTLDRPWEGSNTNFFTVLRDGDLFRMYYEAWEPPADDSEPSINVCYAESTDGLHWHRPELGLYEWAGSRANNIIMQNIPDNITVMLDTNPACPPAERIKAVMEGTVAGEKALVIKASADGIHFEQIGHVCIGYGIDSQNTLHWDARRGRYFCYFRDNLKNRPDRGRFRETTLRRIMVTESADLKEWSIPVPLDYCGGEEYPLYTNCVSAYDRYYIGFPSRYAERREWNDNFDQLATRALRRKKYELNPRYGLATTDCVFMVSTDHYHWRRADEAILTPGLERNGNWMYGDCYPAVGGVYRLPDRQGLSIYTYCRSEQDLAVKELTRYVFREDGFACYEADYRGKTLRTKPMELAGDRLAINFRSSARGGIIVRVLDEQGNPLEGYTSCELFGDSLHRAVRFEKPLSALRGQVICLEFEMKDAALYALRIEE